MTATVSQFAASVWRRCACSVTLQSFSRAGNVGHYNMSQLGSLHSSLSLTSAQDTNKKFACEAIKFYNVTEFRLVCLITSGNTWPVSLYSENSNPAHIDHGH